MPQGTEIVLGVRGSDAINRVLTSVNLPKIDLYKRSWEDWFDENEFPDIEDAHTACLRHFFVNVRAKDASDQLAHGPRAATPAGERRFAPFEIEIHFDPHEMGDKPEHAVLGISLSGRYVPTFLDWRSEYGCIEWVVLDDLTLRMIAKAKEEIAKVFPPAADFEVMFVEKWY